jgi:hypothetical protein
MRSLSLPSARSDSVSDSIASPLPKASAERVVGQFELKKDRLGIFSS